MDMPARHPPSDDQPVGDALGSGAPDPPTMGPAVARRLLHSLERDGIDAATVMLALRLRRELMQAAVASGEVSAFESERDALRDLLRLARAGAWLDRAARRAVTGTIRDDVAAGAARLCECGAPPRFAIVRASLAHAMRAGAAGAGLPGAAGPLLHAATAQCLAMGSRRRARALARVLRKRLPAATAAGTGPGALPVDAAIACFGALLRRWGGADRDLACAAALAAACALPWSAASAAEAADALLGASPGPVPAEAQALAHAVAAHAWRALGDPAEADRHAAACRAVPIARIARRWGKVQLAGDLVEAVRGWGSR